jgi:citrate lyase subunit beta / citryl-CoA lyase
MRRSLLFIPANTPSMLQNADIFDADSVIFDLEDAVLYLEKDAARNLLKSYLDIQLPNTIERIIRINGLDTQFSELDLKLLVSDEIDTIMLPKATFNDVTYLSKVLDQIEIEKKMKKSIQIIPIIERAVSLYDLRDLAQHERVTGLLLGAEDLSTDLEIKRTKEGFEILHARSMIIYAAKAYGIDAIDTPFVHTKDEEGLIQDTTFAHSLGMNAKACIHPNQIEIVNQILSPSEDEIEQALKIVNAATENLRGAFTLDGQMIDRPIIERAKKLLKKARHWKLL